MLPNKVTDMTSDKTALVLGATGGIGGAIATALHRHGWQVRGMARNADAGRKINAQLDWVGGDAMVASDVLAAASDVSLIVHAVNPPGYRNWGQVVLPMIDNTIAAARAVGGARVLLPGTIYNFDPAVTPVIDADTPQHPRSRKGAIRVALEQRLADAAPEVPSVVLRAGDFFGPGARSSWFSQGMLKPGQPVRRITEIARSPGHSWAYLPDLAETAAQLLDHPEQLKPFERVQFEGFYDASGSGLSAAIERVVGHRVARSRFPWWMMHVLAPFGGFPREAAELAALWNHPVRLDNTRLVELLGAEPRTPLDAALRATLIDLGCLGQSDAAAA